MARRKKRRHNRKRRRRNPGLTAAALNPRRRRRHRSHNPRRRRRRHNPVMSVRGVLGMAQQAAVDSLGIVTGKVVSRAVPALVGLNQTGLAGVAIQAATSIIAGFFIGKVNRNFGRMAMAGGFAGIVEGYAKAANLPYVSPALGDEYHPELGLYAVDSGAGRTPLGLYHGGSDGMGDYSAGGEGEDITDSVGLLPG